MLEDCCRPSVNKRCRFSVLNYQQHYKQIRILTEERLARKQEDHDDTIQHDSVGALAIMLLGDWAFGQPPGGRASRRGGEGGERQDRSPAEA